MLYFHRQIRIFINKCFYTGTAIDLNTEEQHRRKMEELAPSSGL